MAGQNINIGTFSWDTNKIENQIAANRMEMQKYGSTVKTAKDAVKEASKEIAELDKRIESETKKQERLNDQLEKGYISQERYNSEIEKSNEVLDELVDEQIKLSKAQADHLIVVNKSEQAIKNLRLENNELNKLLAAGRTELSENENAYRDLNKELNALKTEAKNLGAQMVILEQEGKEGTDEYKKLAAQFAETSQKADNLNNKFKAIDKSVGDNQRTVGAYKEAITSAFSEITQGAMQMASGNVMGGFDMIKNGFKGITAAAKETVIYLLTNPVTAILLAISAAAVGVGLALKEIFDYNQEIGKDIKFLQDKFGDLGSDADKLRIKIRGVADTFGIEFKRITDTVDSLSSAGLTNEIGAIDTIAKGLSTAPNADEFLSKLDMAASKARQTGMNIEQVLNLTKALQGTAIDPNTIYGELEKATNALYKPLSENNALLETFGKDFTEKLLKDIKDGAINTVDALSLIDKKGKELNINAEQQAKLGKELFGKMGANAGAYLENMRLVGESQKDQFKDMTVLQQKTAELTKANTELAKAKDEALKSDALLIFGKNMELLWVKAQTVWYGIVEVVTDVVKWFDKVTGASELMGEVWDAVQEHAYNLWNMVQTVVDVFSDLMEALGLNDSSTQSFIKTLFKTLNPLQLLKGSIYLISEAIKAFTSFIENSRVSIVAFGVTAKSVFSQVASAAKSFRNLDFSEGLEKLKNISIAKEYANARKEAEKIVSFNKTLKDSNAKIQESLDNAVKNTTPKKGGNGNYDTETKEEKDAKKKSDSKKVADAKKAATAAQKALEAEAKRSIELAKQSSEQLAQIAKSELAKYISMNAEKYANEKRMTSERLKLQLDYYGEVLKKQKEVNAADVDAKLFSIQQKMDEIDKKKELGKQLTQNDLKELENLKQQAETITKEYIAKDEQNETENRQKKREEQEKFDSQQREDRKLKRAIDFQEKLLELEENNATEYEINQAQLDEQKQNDIVKLEEDRTNGLISLENYESQKKFIEDKYRNDSKKLNEEKEQAKRTDAANTFGQVSQLLGEETTLGKAAALAEVTMNGINAVQSAYTTAQSSPITVFFPAYPLVQAGIAAAFSAKQAAKIAGFADGGLVTDGFEISRSNGDNRLVTVKDGEVILNEDQQKALGGASIFKMIGVPGFATGGIVGKVSNLTTVQQSIGTGQDYSMMAEVLREAVMEGAVQGTLSGSQQGIGEMADSRKISTQSGF